MLRVGIVGAGPLAAAVASAIAVSGRCTDVVLADPVAERAAAAALGIAEACSIARSDTRLGWIEPDALSHPDVIVVTDSAASGAEWTGESGLALVARVCPPDGPPLVFAGASQGWLLERAVLELGHACEHVVGTAPLALEAAVRAVTALEADAPASETIVRIVGRPPSETVVLWETATIDGEPAVERLDAAAVRRIEARLGALWPPGTFALASAAAFAVGTIASGTGRHLTCLAMLRGARRAVAVPVRLGVRGVRRIALPRRAGRAALVVDPRER